MFSDVVIFVKTTRPWLRPETSGSSTGWAFLEAELSPSRNILQPNYDQARFSLTHNFQENWYGGWSTVIYGSSGVYSMALEFHHLAFSRIFLELWFWPKRTILLDKVSNFKILCFCLKICWTFLNQCTIIISWLTNCLIAMLCSLKKKYFSTTYRYLALSMSNASYKNQRRSSHLQEYIDVDMALADIKNAREMNCLRTLLAARRAKIF